MTCSGMRLLLLLASSTSVARCADASATAECSEGVCDAAVDSASSATVDEASLLQARTQVSGAHKATSSDAEAAGTDEQQKKKAEGFFGPDHYVQFDGETKTEVKRKQLHGNFVREVLIKYPLDANSKIQVKGNQAFIPFTEVLNGRFSRNARGGDQKDYGVTRAAAFVGKKSMISDKVKLAFAEKSHTLYFPEKVSDFTEQKIRQAMAAQTPQQAQEATQKWPDRHMAMASFAGPLGLQIIGAGKDKRHVNAVRQMVAQNNGQVTKNFNDAMARANQELANRQQKRTETKPIRSSVGCIHLENAEDMEFYDDGVVVPLEKMLTGYRGRLASVPNAEYQMSTGVVIFRHNQETNSIDMFFGFSAVIGIYDTAGTPSTEFMVGPLDGVSYPNPREGREDSDSLSFFSRMAASQVNSYPIDYTYMHHHRDVLGCPDNVLLSMVSDVGGIQNIIGGHMSSMMSAMMNFGDTMKKTMRTVKTQAACGIEFLRPADDNQPVAYGVFEAVGLLHVLMEMPGPVQAAAFSTSDTWNEFSLL